MKKSFRNENEMNIDDMIRTKSEKKTDEENKEKGIKLEEIQLEDNKFEDKNLNIDIEKCEKIEVDEEDLESIESETLLNMDKYQRFEHRFPFYKMHVHSYIAHI